jgi:hypothetical protein
MMALSRLTVRRGVMWASFVSINIGLISSPIGSYEVIQVAI